MNIDHIYICHWTKLVERKTHILQQLGLLESGEKGLCLIIDQ